MKVNLNIEEDKLLRDEIKKLIKGQITSTLRDEVREVIMSAMSTETKNLNPNRLEQLVNSTIATHVNSVVNSGYNNDHEPLKRMIKVEIQKHIEGMRAQALEIAKEAIFKAVEEKFEFVVQREVEKQVKKYLQTLLVKE